MNLVLDLAIRDLLRERFQVLCNVAILAGVLVPLLVLFGVKNGIYDALIGELLSDPGKLQIDTSGNNAFSVADAEEVRMWGQAGYVTLKTRSIFDFVRVRPEEGRGRADATLIPSGSGDPFLPEGVELGLERVALTASLAGEFELNLGDRIDIISQAPERPRALRTGAEVVAIVPAEYMSGRAIFADIALLDLFEAYYDEYALPDYGVTEGRDLAERQVTYEGLRVFAKDLESLAPLQSRLEAWFGIRTEADTAEVQSTLNLGRNLNRALLMTAAFSALGLVAALIFGFWGNVARRKPLLATLALLGLDGRSLWLFPVIQATISAVLGLIVSFGIFAGAALVAERLFGGGLTRDGGLVSLSLWQGVLISLVVLIFVLGASFAAARAAQRVDPATVLREGAT